MLPPLTLTEPESITLQELAGHHPFPGYRRRALGILALAKGHPYPLVAEILGVTLPTPYNWAKAWSARGLAGLLGGHQGGAPAKPTAALVDTAEAIARAAPCTLAQTGQGLREIHPDAPKSSLDSLAAHLKKRGLPFARTRLTLKKKRCPDQFKAAQANLERCQAAARAGKLSLFCLDESGFSTVPNVQRAWSPKGKPHAADASAPRARVNVAGALDYASGTAWHDLHRNSVRRDAVVALVDRIAKREGRMPLTLVVLDNAQTHHNIDPDKLDEWLVEHRLVLMHLPPYSPELNPIEIVWKHLKHHWRRFITWSKEELFEQVQKLMAGIGSSFKISFS